MKQKTVIIKLLIVSLTFFIITKGNAQQNKIDSTIFLLNKSHLKSGVDSATFNDAIYLISKTKLNDTAINLIEKRAAHLDNGSDAYFSYAARFAIMLNLSFTDPYKAIPYGKRQIAQLEESKLPYAIVIKTNFLRELRVPYRNTDKLSEGFEYYTDKLKKYKSENDSSGITTAYYVLSGFYYAAGLIDHSIYNLKRSLIYMDTANSNTIGPFEDQRGIANWANNTGVIGDNYSLIGNYEDGSRYLLMSLSKSGLDNIPWVCCNIALAKIMAGQLDSVPYYLNKVEKSNSIGATTTARLLQIKGLYKIKMGELDEAKKLLMQCWQMIEISSIPAFTGAGIIDPDYYLAMIRKQQNRFKDAITLLTADIIRLGNLQLEISRDYKLLAELYEKTGEIAKANMANKRYISLQDSVLAGQAKYRNISFETEQEMAEKELAITKLQSDNKISVLSRNFSIGIIALLLLLTGLVYFRFRSKQKDNKVLQKTLGDLKSTQAQLIQSEKMVSLGELTAGIAHEIQNPLNFINNFSEVSSEMIEELKEELQAGNTLDVNAIANDLDQNLQKIVHHGKRADSIVKNMLQHSRQTNSQKEPTDINALADEYLRLSYHGLRAKDKSFNALMKTQFDPAIGDVQMSSQEVGRVLLNLYNNAFYSVMAKKKMLGGDFHPTIYVTTQKLAQGVGIKVRDNGTGIPQKVLDKIYQPFFTTKPTGEGTGLGLSMSYDIITKGHGGTLTAHTKEGEYAQFDIVLPV